MSWQDTSRLVWRNVCRLALQPSAPDGATLDAVHRAVHKRVGHGQLQRLSEGGNVTLRTLEALARALGVPISSLFDTSPVAREPAPAYTDTGHVGAVAALAQLSACVAPEHRASIADLAAAWLRAGVDDGRSAAITALLASKRKHAA